MNGHELQKLTAAGIGLGAAVNYKTGTGTPGQMIVRITPRRGDVLETESYDEAMDHICGNTVDRVSLRPATVVGAEDTLDGSVICRPCLLTEPGRMSDRYRHLNPRELKSLLARLDSDKCRRCGRSFK